MGGDKQAIDTWHLFGQKLAWLLTMDGSLSSGYDLFAREIKEVSSQWLLYVSSDTEEIAARRVAFIAQKGFMKRKIIPRKKNNAK